MPRQAPFIILLDVLLVSLFSIFCFQVYLAEFRPPTQQYYVMNSDQYLQLVQSHQELLSQEPTPRIHFVGNSLTHGIDLEKWGVEGAINLGVPGDFSKGVRIRIGAALDTKPETLFLMIGINDLLAGVPVQEVAGEIQQIIQQCQQRSPETRILLQSLLPVVLDDGLFVQSEEINRQVLDLNQRLQIISKEHSIEYIDLHRVFLNGQVLDKRYTYDGLHLNEIGYELWLKNIAFCLN